METQQTFFLMFCAMALLAGTVRTVKYNLCYRPADRCPFILISLLNFIECLLWGSCFLAILAAAPHPITPVILVIGIGSVATARRMRLVEEKQSLNSWLQLASKSNQPMPELLDQLGNGYRTKIARAAKRCSRSLAEGEPFYHALKKSRLPVNAVTCAMLANPDRSATESFGSATQGIRNAEETGRQRQSIEIQKGVGYIVAIVFLAWAIGRFVRTVTNPLLNEWGAESNLISQSYEIGRLQSIFESMVAIGDFLAIVLALWLILVLFIHWLPNSLACCVPWFGRMAIDRWRLEILESLELGMKAGNSEREILSHLVHSTRNLWIRLCCNDVLRSIEMGHSLSGALRNGKLVSKKEYSWLNCASENQNLQEALGRLRAGVERRNVCQWRLRMAWTVPLATVLVGAYVFIHAYYLFYLLSKVIYLAA